MPGRKHPYHHRQPYEQDLYRAGGERHDSGDGLAAKSRPARTDFGLMTYDPAFMNTASCKSSITYIDGGQGNTAFIAAIRIEVLAERCTFLEVAYLLLARRIAH